MQNLARELKKQRDKEARLRQSDPAKSVIISDADGVQVIANPGDTLTLAVESLNALTGDVILAAGDNVTITPSGQTLTIAAADGASVFTDLMDTPVAYTGAGGKFVTVKATEDGLEFVDAPTGGSGAFDWGSITVAAGMAQDWGSLA